MIQVRIRPGSYICDAIETGIEMAKRYRESVAFRFNDVLIVVSRDSSIDYVYDCYARALERASAAEDI